jgi:lipopolysaccharide/colanic/teichoic acid biosynthesis glycosyltransferase
MAENNQYAAEEEGSSKAAFVKIKNDPRITKLGEFFAQQQFG